MSPRQIVVSGGGTGIGLAVAEAFAADGDRVTLLGRRQEVLRAAAEKLNVTHGDGTASWCTADLSEPEQVRHAAQFITECTDAVDVLVTNASGNGGSPHDGTLEGVASSHRADFAANELTAVLLTEALLAHVRRPGGRIVHLSSVAALRGPGSCGDSKAAVNTYTFELAEALGVDGITVNAVAPGFVADLEVFDDRTTTEFVADTETGKPPLPLEIAATVRYLALPEAGYLTGRILHINGGAALGR